MSRFSIPVTVAVVAAMILTFFIGTPLARAGGVGGTKYHSWSTFGVGSSSTLESKIDSPKGQITSITETKLIEKTDDHVILEITTNMVMNGQNFAGKPNQVTIKDSPEPTTAPVAVGTEDVDAAGKTFTCKIYTGSRSAADKSLLLKVWSSDQVPGGIVKMELNEPTAKVHSLLKSFEVK